MLGTALDMPISTASPRQQGAQLSLQSLQGALFDTLLPLYFLSGACSLGAIMEATQTEQLKPCRISDNVDILKEYKVLNAPITLRENRGQLQLQQLSHSI